MLDLNNASSGYATRELSPQVLKRTVMPTYKLHGFYGAENFLSLSMRAMALMNAS